MADFASIRFVPERPLLRELSADRLNSILAEIKRNKPLPGRGITVRQTGQGTAIDLAASISRGGTSTSASPQPWDLIARENPNSEGQYLVTVRPGTLSGILPTNWDEEFSANDTGLYYAKAVIATDGEAITGVTIDFDTSEPQIQDPQKFSVQTSIEYLFGLFAGGTAYRVIGSGHITVLPQEWLIVSAAPPAAPGESPYGVYYRIQ